jgi:hypothetical protein
VTEQAEVAHDRRASERQAERRIAAPARDLGEQPIDARRRDIGIGCGRLVDLQGRQKSGRIDLEPPEEIRERAQQRDREARFDGASICEITNQARAL